MELPEVETIRRGLLPLVGERLRAVKILAPKMVFPDSESVTKNIKDKTLEKITRQGKYLLFHFNQQLILVMHLKMTGQLILSHAEQPPSKHTRVVFNFGHWQLHFNDVRKFGFLKLINSNHSFTAALGPEPLEKDFTVAKLTGLIKQRLASKRPLKGHLLDQTFLAGLGNIYADEVLFRSKLNPLRLLKSLSKQEIALLHQSLITVLKEAIAAGGTSFSDYRNAQGEKGDFFQLLKVYQRAGQPCFNCKKLIQKLKIAGRSSYFCPHCQR